MAAVSDQQNRLQELGRLVRARRGALNLDVEPISRNLRMGKETWKAVETGERRARPTVYGRIETALGWPEGSIERYLDGGPAPDSLLAVIPTDEGGSIEVHAVTGDAPGALPAEYWTLDDDDRALADRLRGAVDDVIRRLAAPQ